MGLAVGAIFFWVGSASAATISYQLSIDAGGQTATLSNISGDYTFTPSSNGGSFQLINPVALNSFTINSWSSSYANDPFVTNNLNVTNTTASTQIFTVTVTSPSVPQGAPTGISGSIALALTNGPGASATLSSNSPSAVYTALIDGSSTQTLFNDPFSLSCAGAACSNSNNTSFGIPTPLSGPAVSSSIGITITFTLSPGASAGVTSAFDVVPEPTTFALVGAGILGLVAARKARRQH
jgi:hypothetical protein